MIALRQYMHDWIAALRNAVELDRIDPHELDRLAADAGVSTAELRSLSAAWPNSAALLDRRLAQLGLTEAAHADRAVYRDMQRVCSRCRAKGRCEYDIDTDPGNAIWEHYCPNVGTLRGLTRN